MDPEDKDDVLAYYREIFEDAGEEKESELIEEFGTPRRLAAEILADSYESRSRENGKPMSPWKMILILLLALPVGLPLLICAFFVVLCLAAATLFLSILLICADLCFGLTGILSLLIGVLSFFQSFSIGIFYLGLGLTSTGLFILVTRFFMWLFPWLYGKLKTLYQKTAVKLKGQMKRMKVKGGKEDEKTL